MEFSLSGNAIKTFGRSITCLARIGNELTIQASPSQVTLHTINSSRSAYQSVTLKPRLFDVYSISSSQVLCSMLLKAVCSVLRTSPASIDHLIVRLPDAEAPKIQWALECFSGMKKTYWITCNAVPDVQHLSLDRNQFPSNFIVRPRDLTRLLANFQSSLSEITVIATEPMSVPLDAASEIGGKAVELRSYMDPSKENETLLHTQLWIDPNEEFLTYTHSGDPVDITFSVKELKAFLSYCEGCEVDIQIYFEKAGEPILMAPKSGLENELSPTFDSNLVLATMLASQLHDGSTTPLQQGKSSNLNQPEPARSNDSNRSSEQTKLWSDLSARSGNFTERINPQIDRTFMSNLHVSDNPPLNGKERLFSQHHQSNWMNADDDGENNNDDESEFCIAATPPYDEDA